MKMTTQSGMTTVETSSLEAELQKSTLDSCVIDKEKAEKFKEEGNESFKSNLILLMIP